MESDAPIILVVEDEPIIRLCECEVAEEAGFLALAAINADEALIELESSPGVQILLTDVRMPSGSLDGFELAETVRQRWPDVTVVVTSCLPENIERARASGLPFVPKPFTTAQLVSAVRNPHFARS